MKLQRRRHAEPLREPAPFAASLLDAVGEQSQAQVVAIDTGAEELLDRPALRTRAYGSATDRRDERTACHPEVVETLRDAVALVIEPLHRLPVVAPVAANIGRLAETSE